MYKKLQLAILLVVLILALVLNGCTTPPEPIVPAATPAEAPTESPTVKPDADSTPAPEDASADELLMLDDTSNWDALMPGIPAPNQGMFSSTTTATSEGAILAQRVFLENVNEDTWNVWKDAMPDKGWTASTAGGTFNESLRDLLADTFDLTADNETWLGKDGSDIVDFESCDGGLVQAMYNPLTKNMIITKL